MAEYELVKTEKCIISIPFHAALESYRALLKQNPKLIQRGAYFFLPGRNTDYAKPAQAEIR